MYGIIINRVAEIGPFIVLKKANAKESTQNSQHFFIASQLTFSFLFLSCLPLTIVYFYQQPYLYLINDPRSMMSSELKLTMNVYWINK